MLLCMREWGKAAARLVAAITAQHSNIPSPLHSSVLGGCHHCAALQHSLPAMQAFEMYAQQGKWEAAHKAAAGYLSEQEVSVSVQEQEGAFSEILVNLQHSCCLVPAGQLSDGVLKQKS